MGQALAADRLWRGVAIGSTWPHARRNEGDKCALDQKSGGGEGAQEATYRASPHHIRKKSLALSEKADLSEREKASEMSRLSRKKLTQKHVRKKIVVGRKFMGGSAGKRSRNVKLVDSRMRADSKR